MTRFDRCSKPTRTTWTLARDGHTVTCRLVCTAAGYYVLQLTHDGYGVVEERCAGPQHALTRSVEAFNAFMRRGWLHESARN